MSSKADFKAWLQANQDHLKKYEAWEVARLALSCGFSMDDIAPDLSVWISQSRRKLKLWDNPLLIQWLDLWTYERGREDEMAS